MPRYQTCLASEAATSHTLSTDLQPPHQAADNQTETTFSKDAVIASPENTWRDLGRRKKTWRGRSTFPIIISK